MRRSLIAVCCILSLSALSTFAEEGTAKALQALKPGQSLEMGIYTILNQGHDIYELTDGNSANKPGYHYDADGKMDGMNNTSDMYVVLGQEKALLIDLSNMKSEGMATLKDVFLSLAGNREKVVALTHAHPDHIGQYSAFDGVAGISYYVAAPDMPMLKALAGMVKLDPAMFNALQVGTPIDLGGRRLETVLVTGHTDGSVVYIDVPDKIAFSGDAVGSGSGVWLFGSFESYRAGLVNLLAALDTLHLDDVTLLSGHMWQKGKVSLNRRYVQDMLGNVDAVAKGDFKAVYPGFDQMGLNANIAFGSSIITVNRGKAMKYAKDHGAEYNPYTDVSASTQNYDTIMFCAMTEILKGVEYSAFAPDASLTAAQLDAALNAIVGASPSKDASTAAIDVSQANDLLKAFGEKNGIALGANAAFSGSGEIKRSAAAAVLKAVYDSKK
jgi:Zn-dependent hydrolases, including glyoxylases